MAHDTPDVDNLLTTSGAARIANVSEGAIRNWCKAGKLPYVTLNSGNNIKLFRRDDVEAAAAQYHALRA